MHLYIHNTHTLHSLSLFLSPFLSPDTNCWMVGCNGLHSFPSPPWMFSNAWIQIWYQLLCSRYNKTNLSFECKRGKMLWNGNQLKWTSAIHYWEIQFFFLPFIVDFIFLTLFCIVCLFLILCVNIQLDEMKKNVFFFCENQEELCVRRKKTHLRT